MPNNVTMSYGNYDFSPVPLLTISREVYKSNDGTTLGNTYIYELEGILTESPANVTGGYIGVDRLQDELDAAFQNDGEEFLVMCDSTILIKAYPRVNRLILNRSSDNWVITSPFTITLETVESFPGSGNAPFIKEASESWSLRFVEDRAYYDLDLPNGSGDASPIQLRLNHQVSAVGLNTFNSGVETKGWENARDYVIPLLGYDSTQVSASGVMNLNGAAFNDFNHLRVLTKDELNGSFSVTEDWYVVNSSGGADIGNAIEDFTATVNYGVDTGLTQVNIEGTIEGLETRTYGSSPGDFSITTSKYTEASGAWNIVQNRLYQRAALFGNQTAVRSINIQPLSTVVNHIPGKGIISYSAQYNDRPSNCITGSLTESITITDNGSADLFASIFVLGKASGPVLQDLSTVTSPSREVVIEALFPPISSCAGDATEVATLLAQNPNGTAAVIMNAFEANLETIYSQVFRSQDISTWSPWTGRYTRTTTWHLGSC